MNHKRNNPVSLSYVALAKVPEPGNASVSIIFLLAPFGVGCVEASILPREVAGARGHHFVPQSRHRAGFALCPQAISTREIRAWITTSPDTQLSTSLEVVSTCVRRPLVMSVFCESMVCTLLWKGAGMPGLANGVGRDVFMASSLFFLSNGVFANAYEDFARARKG